MKTSLCPLFLQGRCGADGGRCRFAHSHRELRKTSAFEDPPKEKNRKHRHDKFCLETSTQDVGQISLSEAFSTSCVKLNADIDVKFAYFKPLGIVTSEVSDVCKDLETLLLNMAPEFYED